MVGRLSSLDKCHEIGTIKSDVVVVPWSQGARNYELLTNSINDISSESAWLPRAMRRDNKYAIHNLGRKCGPTAPRDKHGVRLAANKLE